jgi:hypothetical protein
MESDRINLFPNTKMLHRLNMQIPGIIKVGVATLAAIGVTLTQATDWLKLLSVCVALGYSIYKWITDIMDRRKGK